MAKSEELVRVEIQSLHPVDGILSRMNIYVDPRPALREGCYITLPESEGPAIHWQVVKIHEIVSRASVKYGWNNNI